MKQIAININDEYKIKIETGNEFKGSIFQEVYSSAAKNLCDIILQSKNSDEYDSYNNIIAFTGERGKGKSSSMISFRNAILKYDDKDKHASFFNSNDYNIIRKHSFAEIDIIDPSLFRGNESLFEIVVAKMFSKFQEALKKEKNDISDEQRREIIKLFQQVFDNLKIINSDKKEIYNLDSLEALSNLAYSSNLRKCFSNLVDKYLNVIDDKKSFLIVSIDDFDLNISKAYEMLEDIRHFLIQKRIILLIACKTEQLKDSIVNEIVKEYRYKLNLEQKSKVHNLTSIDEKKYTRYDNRKISSNLEITNEYIISELSNKAEKYIEKLIPFNHQIFIPSLSEFCDISFSSYQDSDNYEFTFFESVNNLKKSNLNKLSLIYIGDSDSLRGVVLENLLDSKNEILKDQLINEEKLFIEKNIYDCLLKLIYFKSNIFINKTDYRYHSIFPSTLRELNELIKVFNNDNILENFRKYILNKSINELPENLKNIIIEIDKQDFTFLNSHIINQLGNLRKQFEETNDIVLGNEINFNSYNPSLTSIGEVFSKLKVFYSNVKSTNIYWFKFLDFLSLYYSIRLNQTMQEKPKLLMEYCKGGFYDGQYRIFPQVTIEIDDIGRKRNRDWIQYKNQTKPRQSINSIFKSLEEINAYWLAFFIQSFGSSDQITEYNYPYFRKINQGGGPIYNLIFSPFAIYTNVLFPVEVWYSIFNNDFDKDNIIMNDIIKWKKENTKFQFLLTNPMFFSELTENLSRFSSNAFKSGVLNYFETLFIYFTESIKKAIKLINDKYNYLGLNKNCFDSHPIMLHWNRINSDEKAKNNMSEIFDGFLKDKGIEKYILIETKENIDIDKVKRKLKQYNDYLNNSSRISSRSLTYLINSFDKDSKIYKDLSKMKNEKNKSIQVKKNQVYNYLLNLVNGQST